jgi:nitrogen fixation NifU-like protein
MNEIRELYQEVILDHNKRPRNKGRVEGPTHQSDGYNPLCGDQIHLELKISDGVIEDVKFDGQGCAISTASASLMTQSVKGHTLEEARALFAEMQELFTRPDAELNQSADEELLALSGVRDYPVRIKCAALAWHALKEALEGGGTATTE